MLNAKEVLWTCESRGICTAAGNCQTTILTSFSRTNGSGVNASDLTPVSKGAIPFLVNYLNHDLGALRVEAAKALWSLAQNNVEP